MPIAKAETTEWAGAASKLVPPITEEDCVLFPEFGALAREESKPGRGCTVRAGVGWAKRTNAEIAIVCTPATPTITNHAPPLWLTNHVASVDGMGFYDVGGFVRLGNADTWLGCTYTELQTVGAWQSTNVALSSVNWGMAPGTAWIYVQNKYGKVNAVGREVTVFPGP